MKAILLALTLLVGAVSPALARDVAGNPLSGQGAPVVIGRSYELSSKVMGQTRRINIMLPPGYEEPGQAGQRYPVLYLLDGGAQWQDFFHIAGLVHQGGLWGINQPVILVGIESGDRKAEFTRPSSDPAEQKDFPTHGKSETFRRFLVEELKPAVDGAYRTSGTDGLIGESLAGLFVVDTALRHGGDFDRYIAISPSLWWDNQSLSREAAGLLAGPAPAARSLWLSIADEGGAMQAGMDRLTAALGSGAPKGVVWRYAPYPQEKHSTIYHPAATAAIRALFPPVP